MSMHGDAAYHPPHGHHGLVDPGFVATARGLWAVKWSFLGLLVTALLQLGVVVLTGSVALLADTIHNFADAATAIPLGIAFAVARWRPTRRFPYGYGRVEDLAGLLIVLTILATAVIAGAVSTRRLLHPDPLAHLEALAGAAVLGFLGNETVARVRIRIGREIGSAALVADGQHARADGLTSLGVVGSALGAWLGYPLADPIIGLLITLVILRLVWQAGGAVLTRMLDGVDPRVLEAVEHAAAHVPEVQGVPKVRARWVGHHLALELDIVVSPDLSVTAGHVVATEVRHRILHQVPHVSSVTVHVDPATLPGERFHRVEAHAHDGLPVHSHG
jgi:cation diffusion facilitator family transporter